ncbi:MAG: hypothetical protein ACFFDI_21165 [Promethearchaeota archaeon]
MLVFSIILFLIIMASSAGVVSDKVLSVTENNDILEEEFILTPGKNYFLYPMDLNAGSIYEATIKINPITNDYKIYCRFSYPCNNWVNGESPQEYRQEYIINDGENITEIMTSDIEYDNTQIYIRYDDSNTKEIPTDGISGKLTIRIQQEGVKDSSIFKSKIILNENLNSIKFGIPHFSGSTIYCLGNGTIIKMEITNSNESTTSIIVDSNQTFYSNEWEGSNFTMMTIDKGVTQSQIITVNDFCTDVLENYEFYIEMTNISATANGELAIYVVKWGVTGGIGFSEGLLEITMIFVVTVLIIKRKRRKQLLNPEP